MGNVELDFLIVGAAKAGTTALYRMLEEHPQIFLPKNKEPKFISSQFIEYPLAGPGDSGVEKASCKTMEEFSALYLDKKKDQVAGEGSIDNLFYHENSIPLIKEYFSNPKILIVLRNPVERAYSAYYHLVRDGRETLDFTEALKEERFRRSNNWQFLWSYYNAGLYYDQVKSYLDSFTDVKVILHDDLIAMPEEIMKDVYDFLSVDNTYLPVTSNKYNVSGIPKNRVYQQILYPRLSFFRLFKKYIRMLLSEKAVTRLRGKMKSKMLYKPVLNDHIKRELIIRYQEDIKKLSSLINRDLTMWIIK
ncbi:MAG: sulfotransferase [Gammaproteobacteria bacterium]|nr:sulfotransferase [Gammaproteobacteria bacterium]